MQRGKDAISNRKNTRSYIFEEIKVNLCKETISIVMCTGKKMAILILLMELVWSEILFLL